jgi:HSP20 family protein
VFVPEEVRHMTRLSFFEWPELELPTALARSMQPFFPLHGRRFVPPVEVFEKGGDLHVKVELPGIDPAKDVTVTVEDGYLAIRGERRETSEAKEEGYYRKETFYGAFERHIPIPGSVKESAIKADYKSGILEIVVPEIAKVPEEVKPKRIPIHVG